MEIHTATIGIIGVGRIGGTLAKLLKALGATVLGFDTNPREEMKGPLNTLQKKNFYSGQMWYHYTLTLIRPRLVYSLLRILL